MMCYNGVCANNNQVLASTAGRCPTCGERTALAIGTVIRSPTTAYEIEGSLGIGGMGKVYLARDPVGGQVAVKELYCDDPADLPDAQRRFEREADIQSQIYHPAICAGFGHFTDQGREFMAMEFVQGLNLEAALAHWPNGRMDEIEVLQLGIQILEALSVLHNFQDATGNLDPIVHRDVKPANIILRPTGQICLLDLGIARFQKQSNATIARATVVGTTAYWPLEQLAGNPIPRTDLYATAATMFHLFIGAPFVGDQVDRLTEVDALPLPWQAIFRKALAVDEGNRHRNVEEFRQDLIGLLPPALRPVVAVPAAAPVAPPAAFGPIMVRFRNTVAHMHGPAEYRRPIAGQLVQGTTGMGGITVIPYITDIGGAGAGTGGRGTQRTTQRHGDFDLAVADITVPVDVDRREIELVFEDIHGTEIHREGVTIDRPWVHHRIAAQGAAGLGAVAHAGAAPFRIAGHGVAAAARGVAHGGAVGARGLRQGIAWPFRQAAHGAGVARNAVGNFFSGASAQALFKLLAAAIFAITLVSIAKDWRWVWSVTWWPIFLLVRAAVLSQHNRWPARWQRLVFPRITAVVVGTWLILLSQRLLG